MLIIYLVFNFFYLGSQVQQCYNIIGEMIKQLELECNNAVYLG